jgi:hypothetical protein
MQERGALTEIWTSFGIETVKLSDDLRFFAIWEPSERLGKTTFSDLYEILEDLWMLVTGQDMKGFWRKKKKARFLENLHELYLVVNAQQEIVGFNGWFLAGDIDYINICVDLIGVLPQWEKTAGDKKRTIDFGPEFLQKTIIERAYKRYQAKWVGKPIFVTTRTQNPVVYHLAQKIVAPGSLYPDLSGKVPDSDVLTCAQAYAEKLGIKRETMTVSGKKQAKEIGEDLIWRNAYNPPLYRRRPGEVSKNEDFKKIDDFFRNKLGERDAFILVGRPLIIAEPASIAKATNSLAKSD